MNRYQLTSEARLSAGFLFRLEEDERQPSTETIDMIADALNLSSLDRNRLLVSAGYAPAALVNQGWSEDLEAMVQQRCLCEAK